MIIKSFTGDSVATALKNVRAEMGGDAVVLKTKKIADQGDGNTIEITACIDQPSVAQANKSLAIKPKPTTVQVDRPANRLVSAFAPERVSVSKVDPSPSPNQTLAAIEKKLDELIKLQSAISPANATTAATPVINTKPIVMALRAADFGEAAIADIVAKNPDTPDSIEEWIAPLSQWIDSLSDIKTNFSAGDRIAFVGVSGAGKTSALGKLTAYLLSRKQSVVLATADAGKVGAIDEMYSYSDLLGASVADVVPDGSFDVFSRKHVLIDSSLGQLKDVDRLRKALDAWKPTHRLLVCSALTRGADLARFTGSIASVAPTHVIMTMTDQTHCLGGVLSVCHEFNCKLLFVTNGPSGVGFLTSPDAKSLAASVLSGGNR